MSQPQKRKLFLVQIWEWDPKAAPLWIPKYDLAQSVGDGLFLGQTLRVLDCCAPLCRQWQWMLNHGHARRLLLMLLHDHTASADYWTTIIFPFPYPRLEILVGCKSVVDTV